MPGLMKKLYSPVACDVMFAVVGLASVLSMFRLAATPIAAIVPPDNPIAKGAAILAAVLAGSLVSILTSRIDQTSADDFVFGTLTKSALMGMMAFLLASAGWYVALVHSFGALSSFSMIMLAVACWTVCYFIVRLRGTSA